MESNAGRDPKSGGPAINRSQPNNVMLPCMHLHWPWPARAPSNWLAGCGYGPHPRSPRFMKTFWMHIDPSASCWPLAPAGHGMQFANSTLARSISTCRCGSVDYK
ncbi:unnamed protein product [Urochloa humidicola]